MRQFGKVEIPQSAFISALKMDGWVLKNKTVVVAGAGASKDIGLPLGDDPRDCYFPLTSAAGTI